MCQRRRQQHGCACNDEYDGDTHPATTTSLRLRQRQNRRRVVRNRSTDGARRTHSGRPIQRLSPRWNAMAGFDRAWCALCLSSCVVCVCLCLTSSPREFCRCRREQAATSSAAAAGDPRSTQDGTERTHRHWDRTGLQGAGGTTGEGERSSRRARSVPPLEQCPVPSVPAPVGRPAQWTGGWLAASRLAGGAAAPRPNEHTQTRNTYAHVWGDDRLLQHTGVMEVG
jgi:hypothetical protein